ncbi:LysR family transcriptional regulator [Marinobacter salinexigens]|uniref:LysR family transcriptional regulator n=1 Tax=Marinobacter salinexigens TaxID=2919747 RepID=A0A5B0VI97_9GAMM|nr:LysR family transcriptional regulator [Marinobacter salinexigens]KAA1174447.1 LysR family transcriptional regulator [Marinobacter salinexigens]
MYDLKELEAFVSVVKTGSLTVSTRELNLPKSTLSRRIRNLEDVVGQPLLRRESRRISPNEAGRVFYRYSSDILALASQGREALDELKEEVSGTLVLRCHESLVRGWFSQLVESFMSSHEGLRVSVQTQQRLPESVDDGVCIWLGDPGDTALRLEPLGQLTQGVYGSPGYFTRFGYPKTPGDLKRHAWVDVLGAGDAGLALQHPCHGAYPLSPPERGFTVDQLCVQGDAITKGRGLGLMPHWLVERRLTAHPGTLEACLPEWHGPVLPVSMLYSHGILPRRVRAFISHVRQSIPAGWWGGGATLDSDHVPEYGTHHATL